MSERYTPMWREVLELYQRDPLAAMSYIGPLLRSRADIMAKSGTTYGGNRKHYALFGWPVNPDYDYWDHLYKRGGLAKRIVQAYPAATWRNPPTITEAGKPRSKPGQKPDETPFEKAWKALADKRKVWHYLRRTDTLARKGQYAVLFMGFADGAGYEQLTEPVGALARGGEPWAKLLYLQPYGEDKARVSEWESDPKNERFGLPKFYTITIEVPVAGYKVGSTTRTVVVHHSRVIHVAEDVLESDTEGAPALEPVVNYLLDLEKVHGSAAEAFYQQSPPGLAFQADKDTNVTVGDEEKQMAEDFINGLKRHLWLQGIKVDSIVPHIGDPTAAKEMLFELISGTTGMPKRILVGSERGELASTQDETAWNARTAERQRDYAEPSLLRPFIDRLLEFGVLPPVKSADGYLCRWSDNQALSEEQQSTVAKNRADAISKYAGTPDSQEVVPPDIFLEEVIGFDPEVVERIRDTRQEIWDKELEEMAKDEVTKAEEELRRREILGEGPERPPAGAGGNEE